MKIFFPQKVEMHAGVEKHGILAFVMVKEGALWKTISFMLNRAPA